MNFARKRLLFLIFFITISFALGFSFGNVIAQKRLGEAPIPLVSTVTGTGSATYTSVAPLDLTTLWQAFDIIRQNYISYDNISATDIVRGMVRGMVDALKDPHSEYFDPEETKGFNETLAGNFEGIGAVVDANELGVSVDSVLPKSPAEASGILMGDVIVKIDGTEIKGLSLEDAVKKIRGPAGTKVTLDIIRTDSKGEKSLVEKVVTREHVDVPSIDSKMLDGNVGYIMMSIFGQNTASDFTSALDKLMAKKPVGLIIDLRGNTGGFLDAAVAILSHFVDKGKPVVTIKTRDPSGDETSFSKGDDPVRIPIVLLVNGNSASASEITIGALHDYKLAIIVGEQTYGKGSVQNVFPLGDSAGKDGQMKVTIAKWYTPDDTNIDKVGFTPDIIVKPRKDDYKNKYDRQLDEGKQVLLEFVKTGDIQKSIDEESTRVKSETGATNSGSTDSGSTDDSDASTSATGVTMSGATTSTGDSH